MKHHLISGFQFMAGFGNIQASVHPKETQEFLLTQIREHNLALAILQESCDPLMIENLIKEPTVKGIWASEEFRHPDMGCTHGLTTMYRRDLFELVEPSKVIWLPYDLQHRQRQAALITNLRVRTTRSQLQVVNFRLGYEGKDAWRLIQLAYLAGHLTQSIPTIVAGDSNLRTNKQILSGLLGKVENKKNRERIAAILPGYDNLIPENLYTIKPLRSLPPTIQLRYKLATRLKILVKLVQLQLDYILTYRMEGKFCKREDSPYIDHSFMIVKLK